MTQETLEFRCKDDPEANGRTAQKGDQRYTLTFPLDDGRKVIVHQGREGMNTFAAMLSQMMVDDEEGRVESTPMHESKSLAPVEATGSETPTGFMAKLAEAMPKKPEPPPYWSGVAQFNPEPIRRHAEAFAHYMEYELPRNRQELIALLWTFGEAAHGPLEKMVASYSKIANEALGLQLKPLVFDPNNPLSPPSETKGTK